MELKIKKIDDIEPENNNIGANFSLALSGNAIVEKAKLSAPAVSVMAIIN